LSCDASAKTAFEAAHRAAHAPSAGQRDLVMPAWDVSEDVEGSSRDIGRDGALDGERGK
jgi:hypothetical protein